MMRLHKRLAPALLLLSFPAVSARAQESNDDPPLPPPPVEWKVLKLTFDGYLRVRGDVWNDLDLSRGPTPTTGQPIFPTPAGGGDGHTLTGLDMRFRLEPTLSIGQAVKVHVRADVLDNVGFGSTPDVLPSYTGAAYATGPAQSPESGENALKDAIRIKQAYGEVVLPFGVLQAGRMGAPFNWGTGFFVNNGSCISCDAGDTGDRIALTVPLFGHYVSALYELSASGPYAVPFAQNIDLDARAHVDTFALAFARFDSPEAQRRRVRSGRTLVQYGLFASYRGQELDAPAWTQPNGLLRTYGPNDFVKRDVKSLAADLWVLVQHKGLRAELEAAGSWGRIGDATNQAGVSFTDPVTTAQYGAVASVAYQFGFPLRLRLEGGFASGDDAPGFGVRIVPGQYTSQKGDLDGPQLRPPADRTVNNFRFHPDYHVDLILFRRIIGTVSDAMYMRPSIAVGPFGGRMSGFSAEAVLIASRAIYATTPPGQDASLGVELDVRARWRIEPGFEINAAWGLLLPGPGFKNLALAIDPKPAQALEVILAYRL